MATKRQIKFNIDKKRQCYNQPTELFEHLAQYRLGDFINFDNFDLLVIDDGRSEGSDKYPVKIKANVILCNKVLLGTFTFNNSAKYDGKCFFEFANSALYLVSGHNMEGKCNYQAFLPYVSDILGLSLNNYTEVEVALDTNYNPIPWILKLIKNHNEFDMIVNGKKVEDENMIIDGYGEFFERSRKRRKKYPTIYIKQKKENSPCLKTYNKLSEIQDNSSYKKYIEEWNEFTGTCMYRLEVKFKNEDFKKWQQHVAISGYPQEWGDSGDSEGLLTTAEYKRLLWQFFADKLIYFRNKRTGTKITLIDIIEGRLESI